MIVLYIIAQEILEEGTCCNEFNDYLEKLSCMNGNIVIVGDFNIDWLNTNGSECKQFCDILETMEICSKYVYRDTPKPSFT